MRIRYLLFLLLFLSFLPCTHYAQRGTGLFFDGVQGHVHGGFIMAHDNNMKHLTRGHFPLYHISITGHTDGSRPWHHTYNFPQLGIDFLYTDMAYPDVLGKAWAILPHIKLPIHRAQSWAFSVRHGLGMAYLNRPFNLKDNYKNNAIGSHRNIALNLTFELGWIPFANTSINTGLSFTHFSNGKIITPNKGINIPALKIGIEHQFRSKEFFPEPSIEPFYTHRTHQWLLMAAGGYSASHPPGIGRNQRYMVSSTYNRPINAKHRLGLGYDFFYGIPGKNNITINPDYHQEFAFINHGIHFAFQQDFSRLAFIVQQGVYVWNPKQFSEEIIYNRAGFRYAIHSGWLANLTLKTHMFKAEFIEFGLGYNVLRP